MNDQPSHTAQEDSAGSRPELQQLQPSCPVGGEGTTGHAYVIKSRKLASGS